MIEIIQCLFSGMHIGFYAFFKALPIYEQLSSLKEQLISAATGIPVIIVSVILSIPLVIKIAAKVINKL